MSSSRRSTLSLALTLACSAAQAAPQSDLAQKLDAYVTRFSSQGDFSGAVLVAKDGEVVFQRAYGMANYELGVPNRIDTRFMLASVTKTFTAAAVLKLRDQGKLKLDDPMRRHIPDFPHGGRIKVRHLLAHASGLPDFHELENFEDIQHGRHSLAELVAALKGKPLNFQPGADNRYNNAGYVSLAYLIERVSGQSYGDYLKKVIFQPLAMKDTGVFDRRRITPKRAAGYKVGPPPGGLLNADWFDASYAVGSGSLYSTVGDLYRWGKAVQSKRIVDFFDPPWPYGWGRRRDEESRLEWIEQTGLMPGFQSCLKVYANRDAVIVYLGNSQTSAFSQFKKDLETILFDLDRPVFELPKYNGPAAASFSDFLGPYRHPQAGDFSLVDEGGNLYLFWEKFNSRRYLTPVSPTELFDRAEATRLELVRGEDGKPAEIVFRAPWGVSRCPRR